MSLNRLPNIVLLLKPFSLVNLNLNYISFFSDTSFFSATHKEEKTREKTNKQPINVLDNKRKRKSPTHLHFRLVKNTNKTKIRTAVTRQPPWHMKLNRWSREKVARHATSGLASNYRWKSSACPRRSRLKDVRVV